MSATYLAVIAVSMTVLGLYVAGAVRSFSYAGVERDLQDSARLVEEQLAGAAQSASSAEVERLVASLSDVSDTRFTVVDENGAVLADSAAEPSAASSLGDRPEVSAALLGAVGSDVRESVALGGRAIFVAVPIRGSGQIVGVVRAAVSLADVDRRLETLYLQLALGILVAAAIVGALGLVVSDRIRRRLRAISRGAERFAAGDFSYTIEPSRTSEFGAVAASLNQMARRLDETIRTITEQKSEREAILRSMVEGVVAVDLDERVINLNGAAAELLGIDARTAPGRSIQEAVRNPDLQHLVAEALAEQEPVEGEIQLRTREGDRVLQVNGTGLRDASGVPIGAIAVLNDVTRLKALEQMRSDFVANVSHEIKTPVTSIKGFAETLLDGALEEPHEARRFVSIIVGQADRLNSIVEDLLALSSAEQLDGRAVDLQESNVTDVLQVAVEVCGVKAEERSITLDLQAPGQLFANISPPLLEQAVVNLIDNAVKYSPEGSTVAVSQRRTDEEIVIAVQDHGCGIAREHLPHLFQRFYRVDKARSRAMGGTGLGLAIVKHIVHAHGGHVTVESSLGRGSTFTIRLPRS